MKKILFIFALFSLVFAGGCINSSVEEQKTNTSFSSSFNDESYVWESLYFPTNRVMDRK